MGKGIMAETNAQEERRWKIESAADAIIRYAEIKQDKPLYKAGVAEVRKRQRALGAVLKANPGRAVGKK